MVNPMEGTACRPLHPPNGIFRDEVLNSWGSFFTLRQPQSELRVFSVIILAVVPYITT